eukprot:g8606.t1
MISSVLLVNLKGEILIWRAYKDPCRRKKGKQETRDKPVVSINGSHFLYTTQGDIVLVAASKDNVNVMLVLKLLYKMVDLFKAYFGGSFDENQVRKHFQMIFVKLFFAPLVAVASRVVSHREALHDELFVLAGAERKTLWHKNFPIYAQDPFGGSVEVTRLTGGEAISTIATCHQRSDEWARADPRRLDEIIDYGYPQILEVDVLKKYITQGGAKNIDLNDQEQLKKITVQATGVCSWRAEGIKHRKNEVFIDVIENVNILMSTKRERLRADVSGEILVNCKLSGMPECKFGMNDKLLMTDKARARSSDKGIALDDYRRCRAPMFARTDALAVRYRITENIESPFKLLPNVKVLGRSRLELSLQVTAMYDRNIEATNVRIDFPCPKNTAKAHIPNTAHGKARFDPAQGAVVWRIRRFPGRHEYNLLAEVELASTITDKQWVPHHHAWKGPWCCFAISAAMQAAAPSADSWGAGKGVAEVEVTSLSELGSLAVDALNLFVDNQDPPAAAAGAGSDSSRWAGAASSAGSGPTIFPPSVMEHEDRDLELEEPFAGPADQEVLDDAEANPFDSPTAEGQQAPVVEHSLGDTQDMHPSPDQDHPVPEETTSASANAPNLADQGDPAPAEEEPEEFVPPETLIAQASPTPNSPPLSTNNLFDPLGEDEDSSAEEAVNEEIAQRIQEQYDLETALKESAQAAGVEPEPADLGIGEAAATGAGRGERDRTRRRGCRAGAKRVAGRENLSYGTTCEYISAQLGDSTYARFGRRFNLPHIPPQVARRQYPEWFGYVLRHSDSQCLDSRSALAPYA